MSASHLLPPVITTLFPVMVGIATIRNAGKAVCFCLVVRTTKTMSETVVTMMQASRGVVNTVCPEGGRGHPLWLGHPVML